VEVNISTKLNFGNILYGCFRQVGCLMKVTANSGLTVQYLEPMFHNVSTLIVVEDRHSIYTPI